MSDMSMTPPILICAATPVEAKACRRGIERAAQSARFEVLQTGMGLVQARLALEIRLADAAKPKPSLIVSTGFAGSWNRELAVGTWALGHTVEMENQNGPIVLKDPTFPNADRVSIRVTPARIISLARASSKRKSSQNFGASPLPVVVDMESHAWAEVSQGRGISYRILRLISDNPDAPLPNAVGSFASAFTAESALDRFHHILRGLSHAATEPRVLARFVARSMTLPAVLEKGWQEIAST